MYQQTLFPDIKFGELPLVENGFWRKPQGGLWVRGPFYKNGKCGLDIGQLGLVLKSLEIVLKKS
ncbi:MAG: hypothetical protein CM15mP22_6720 [Gammaproteobacteria bacterium]|nr:MAG: hypothetical protein CM15mP22_6720 [Gammaproteobacteria bacterium]